MEVIRINDKKLKVMLSAEDMRRYELDCEAMDYDNTETRKALWQILDEAKKETGFDAAKDRVFVQVYPGKGGGCEMFVTKVGAFSEAGAERRPAETAKRRNIYMFDSLETLLMMCDKLRTLGYSDTSEAYADRDSENVYLVVKERNYDSVLPENSLGEYGFLSEYGKRRNGSLVLAYIKEHCACLDASDAVHMLSGLA